MLTHWKSKKKNKKCGEDGNILASNYPPILDDFVLSKIGPYPDYI